MFLVLGDIAESDFVSPFCGLSASHVRALCANGRCYRHAFFCIRQSPPRWLTSVNPIPSSPNFAPKWFERRRHSMANCSGMVRGRL